MLYFNYIVAYDVQRFYVSFVYIYIYWRTCPPSIEKSLRFVTLYSITSRKRISVTEIVAKRDFYGTTNALLLVYRTRGYVVDTTEETRSWNDTVRRFKSEVHFTQRYFYSRIYPVDSLAYSNSKVHSREADIVKKIVYCKIVTLLEYN